jgi:hypothetical protein
MVLVEEERILKSALIVEKSCYEKMCWRRALCRGQATSVVLGSDPGPANCTKYGT